MTAFHLLVRKAVVAILWWLH